jgi:hypothetical protein
MGGIIRHFSALHDGHSKYAEHFFFRRSFERILSGLIFKNHLDFHLSPRDFF